MIDEEKEIVVCVKLLFDHFQGYKLITIHCRKLNDYINYNIIRSAVPIFSAFSVIFPLF